MYARCFIAIPLALQGRSEGVAQVRVLTAARTRSVAHPCRSRATGNLRTPLQLGPLEWPTDPSTFSPAHGCTYAPMHPNVLDLEPMSRRTVAITLAAVLLVASVGAAQFRGRGGRQGFNGRPLHTQSSRISTAAFNSAASCFETDRTATAAGWNVDFPRADENLSIRLSELSRTPVSMDQNREPKTLLLNLRQPEVFHCPILMMTEPGGAYFDEEEVVGLRKYLQKGGFLWADDFWGEYAWSYWESQIRRVLPSGRVSDLRRADRSHPVSPDVHGEGISADSRHRILGRCRSHLGTT